MKHIILLSLLMAGSMSLTPGVSKAQNARSGSDASKTKTDQDGFDPANPAPLLKVSPEVMKRNREIGEEANVFWQPAHELYSAGKFKEAEKACLQAIAVWEKYGFNQHPIETAFLGEIYLRLGQNQKALDCFRQVFTPAADTRLNLNIALAFCRLDNFAQAKRFYLAPVVQEFIARGVLRYGFYGKSANADALPGIDEPETLYASVLLAHGVYTMNPIERELSLADFQQADKVYSKNPLVHLYWGMALHDLERDAEAIPHFQTAVQRGNGVVMKSAQENLTWMQQNVESLKRRQEQQAKKQAEKTPVPATQSTTQPGPKP